MTIFWKCTQCSQLQATSPFSREPPGACDHCENPTFENVGADRVGQGGGPSLLTLGNAVRLLVILAFLIVVAGIAGISPAAGVSPVSFAAVAAVVYLALAYLLDRGSRFAWALCVAVFAVDAVGSTALILQGTLGLVGFELAVVGVRVLLDLLALAMLVGGREEVWDPR